MTEKVSIIIPVYNAEKRLKKLIDGCISQTYENIEIVLIDDGSTDNSAEICKEYEKSYENVKYFHKENGGVSSARNLGIEKATGKYIFFLDSDDIIDGNVIESLANKYSEYSLTSVRMIEKYGQKENKIQRVDRYETNKSVPAILANELQGFVCGYLFERTKCPKFETRTAYCEDTLFLIDYINENKIKNLCFLPVEKGLYYYVQNDNSMTNRKIDVFKKLKDIEISMLLLDEKTEHKYAEMIENRKNELFSHEAGKASDTELRKILELFNLKEYTGKSFFVKKFSKAFRDKNIKKLRKYKRLEEIVSSITGLFKV